MSPVLEVNNLKTHFFLDEGVLKAVDGVSFKVSERQTLGIIGESGCGKSITAQSILQIVPHPGRIVDGEIILYTDGEEPVFINQLDPFGKAIRDIRGRHIAMVFQEPMTSLSPIHTVGDQIMEALLLHKTQNRVEARDIALDMLNRVGISNPSQRIEELPHQLSGGMRQRVMIAMALCCEPKLLIADEPTTALDVTVQAQILELLQELQGPSGMSMIYITHDLSVIAEIADEVAVMYLGRIVEQGPTREILDSPLHPYTQRLLKSVPKLGHKARSRLEVIEGNVPIPLDPPRQCGFFSRCPESKAGICDVNIPALLEINKKHSVRCFLHSDEIEGVEG